MIERFSFDTVVIGAGAVGLSCAATLAEAGHEVVVLERTGLIGSGISSRNSEVIHAGVYYPPGSLKARLCVEGRDALYVFCAERKIAHRRCGKLIVATSVDESRHLEKISLSAAANGAGLSMIDGKAALALEPALSVKTSAALLSPLTGIVDSHGLMMALQGSLEDHGGQIAFNCPVISGEQVAGGIEIYVGGSAKVLLTARHVVNAAGLYAIAVAQRIAGSLPSSRRSIFAKGSYFKYSGHQPFSRLIYPAPVDGGLGVHLTFDLTGQARFGPDVEWLETVDADELDYTVYAERREGFIEGIKGFWPSMNPDLLTPDYAGVRPKLAGRGEGAADFQIEGPETHGINGLINLLGIESPGLTASLAIARYVQRLTL